MLRLLPEGSGELSDVPGTGPAPVLLRLPELLRIAPHWERLTAQIEADQEAVQTLGYVSDMELFFGWALQQVLQQLFNFTLSMTEMGLGGDTPCMYGHAVKQLTKSIRPARHLGCKLLPNEHGASCGAIFIWRKFVKLQLDVCMREIALKAYGDAFAGAWG